MKTATALIARGRLYYIVAKDRKAEQRRALGEPRLPDHHNCRCTTPATHIPIEPAIPRRNSLTMFCMTCRGEDGVAPKIYWPGETLSFVGNEMVCRQCMRVLEEIPF